MKSSASNNRCTQISSPDSILPHITITSLGGLGDGIADINGKPLFVPKSCMGDVLEVRIIQQTTDALRGQIIKITRPGEARVIPPCRYFESCGGCSLQHLKENSYKQFKTQLFHNALKQAGFVMPDARMHFIPASSRRRVELRLHHDKGMTRLAYFLPGTRDLLPIDECLILSPALQRFLAPLSKALTSVRFKHQIASLKLTEGTNGIDLVLLLKDAVPSDELAGLAEILDVARLSTIINKSSPKVIVSKRPVTVALGKYDVPLPPDSFLQATLEAQQVITDFILENIPSAGIVADLFSGIGTYSFSLLGHNTVHAVENHAGMVQALKKAAHEFGVASRLSAECRDLFKTPLLASELKRFGSVVINPPRPGAKSQMEAIARSDLKHVVMVSCNPASFARDAKILGKAGFTLKKALSIDQFVYSPHLELATLFQR